MVDGEGAKYEPTVDGYVYTCIGLLGVGKYKTTGPNGFGALANVCLYA